MNSEGTRSARDSLLVALVSVAALFSLFHVLVGLFAWFNPPSDLFFKPTVPDASETTQFAVEFGSAAMWTRFLCGIFVTLPPALLLAAIWSHFVQFVLTRGAAQGGHFLLTFPLVLLCILILPILPNDVSRSIGFRAKGGGDPNTGHWFWILFAPMFFPLVILGIGFSNRLMARLIVAGIAATYMALYLTAVVIERWKRQGSLCEAEAPQFHFSLRALMLTVFSAAAYASGLVLIFR